ncbi:hypothetical protein J3U37_12030 [Gilliamella sp. B3172]|uniref:hypothetical protein n=1 Tax=Gilliamella sp. B3172 TaxID=2818006 RepID=UPI00226A2DA6|nr:hypothetical protein [Gilliamella sp. B3172]MCX8640835.1 hypothetical protein [Gilliamella sp. B3172]
MKTNRKYLALLFLLIIVPVIFGICYILTKLVVSMLIYFLYGDFIFNIKDFYLALKVAFFGIPTGGVIWFLECRRLGIKIFGK